MAQGFENINFKINFQMGDRNAFATLKKELQEVKTLAASADFGLDQKALNNVLNSANAIERAMTKAYDPQLNTVNIQKFNNLLKQSGTDINKVKDSLSVMGANGSTAFMKMTGQLMEINPAIKQTNSFLNDLSKTLFNTIKYTVFNNLLSSISTTISQSYHYVKDLDRSLNDIRIVTGKSADEMERFAEQANDAAKSLAVTTKDYTQGSLIYYQQGLDDETVKTLTDITAKTSNVTQQSMSTVSEQLTAVWNGYQVANQAAEEGMQVYEEYVDKMAAVGAATASDLEELSTAMSKVASAASSMGVDFDDLNAQIATIVSVTRQAPESVGTALKTIYARLGDLKVDGVDEFGTKLGEVSAQLQTMGINIIDQQGNMRNMSEVIAEVAEKQDTWTSAQRQAAAVAMAGKRQYNNLIALFDNQDMYGEALETSMNAAGTLEKQQEIALESIANKMDVLRATAEDLYDSLFDTKTISGFVDAGTKVLQFLADFTDSVGGLNNILPMLAMSLTQLFSKQIAAGAEAIVTNIIRVRDASILAKENMERLKLVFSQSSFWSGENADGRQGAAFEQGMERLSNLYSQIGQYQNIMNEQEKQNYDLLEKQQIQVNAQRNSLADMVTALEQAHNEYNLISEDTFKNAENAQLQLKEVNKVNEVVKILETTLDQMNRMEAKGTQSNFRFMLNGIQGGLNSEAIKNYMAEIQKQFNLTEDAWRELTNSIDTTDFSTAKKSFQALIEKLKETGASATEIEKITTEVERSQGTISNFANAIGQQLNLRTFINNITQGVSAIGQLAMAINTLKNIGNIQDNDDLSAGDKILQTVMNLSFALSGLLSVIKNFDILAKSKQLIQGVAAGFDLLTAKISAHKAAQSVDNAVSSAGSWIQQRQVDNILKTVSAKQLDLIATNKNNVGLVRYNITKSVGNKLTEAQKNAITKGLIAKAAEKQATDKMTASQLAQNASILASPITWIIAGISAIIAALVIYNKHIEKQLKNQIELSKAEIEEANSKHQQVEANKELYDSYMNIYTAYQKNQAAKEDVADVTKELSEKYNIEISKIDELNGKYDKYTELLRNARKEELEADKASQERAKNAAENELYATTKLSKRTRTQYDENLNATGKYELHLGQGMSGGDEEEIKKYFENSGLFYFDLDEAFSTLDIADPEALVERYDKLVELKNIIDQDVDISVRNESEYYRGLKDFIEENAEAVSHYKDSLTNLNQVTTQLKINDLDFYNIDNLEDFENKREELIKLLKEEGISYKEASELADTYIQKQSDAGKNFLNQSKLLQEVSAQTKESLDKIHQQQNSLDESERQLVLTGKVDLSTAFSTEAIQHEIENAKRNLLGTYEVTESVSLASTLASGNKLKKADNKALQNLESELPEAMGGFDDKGVNHQLEAIDEVTQYRIQKNEEYLKNYEETIQKEIDFTEKERQKIFASDKEYEQALLFYEQNKTQLTEADRKEREKELADYEALIDKQEELNRLKEEGLSFYDNENLGFTDFITDLEMIENKADLVKSAAELIGEGFKVAASDVEKFSNMFPELLENMTVLEDGSIQLDDEVLKTKLGNIQEELQARTDAKIKEIDQQIQLKEAEQAYLKEKLDALADVLKGESDTQEATDKIHKAGQQYQETLMNITGQEISDLTRFSIKQAGEEGAAFVSMLDQVGRAFEKAANAHYAFLKGEKFEQGEGVSFSGLSQSAEQFAFDEGEKAQKALEKLGAETYQQIYDEAKEAQQQYNIVTGELDTLRKQRGILESSMKAAGNAANRVKAGKAGKESKSGSSKKDKDKDAKEQEDEFDRYWEIKKAIDAVDNALKKLDKDQENLYGYELINSLKQENELLEQQAANYNTLYEMQQQEAAELREQLGAMGLMFDASGAITNYAAATSAALQQYAAAIEQYNAGLIDETTLKVYEKSYENFKKLLERYDKLYYTEMQQTQEKLDEIRRKELANNLKAWEVEIQIHLDKEKMKRDQNDFLKDIKQDFRKVFSDLTIDVKYDEKNFKSLVNDVQTTTKAIGDVEAEIDKMMAGGDSTMFESVSQAQEKLKELQEQLLDQGKALRELYKQVQETYLNGIDQVKDQFDELMSRYEKFNDELEFHKELIELLYGDKAYDLMDKYYETQTKNIEAQIESLRKQADFQQSEFQKSYETAIKSGSKVDMDDFTTQTEDMKKAYENMIEAQGNLNDLVLEGVKILKEQYLNNINEIIDSMNQQIQGTSLDEMKKDQEYTQKLADLFLDDVQKAYKVQTLANKIDQSIANTSNLKAQQKLQALREKDIEYLRTKNNLTQEDVDLAEMRYQIALKEIALEDAQNNKTSMKLTRNEQGNQSYQYVADEDDVASKQQDLLSSAGEYYEKAVEYNNKSAEAWQEIQERMFEELAEIEVKYGDNAELLEQKRAEIVAKYEPIITALLENTEVARQEAIYATSYIFGTVCDQDFTAYKNLTDNQKDLVNGFKEAAIKDFGSLRDYLIGENGVYPELYRKATEVFEETNISSHAILTTMAKEQVLNQDSFKNIIVKGIKEMNQATINYQKELDKLQQIADMDFSKIGESIDKVSQKIDAMGGTTDKMVNNSSQYLDELRRALEAIADKQNSVIEQILAAQRAMQEYINLAAQAKAANAAAQSPGNGPGGTIPGATRPGNGGNDSGGSGESKANYIIQDRMTGTIYQSGYDTLENAKQEKNKFSPQAPRPYQIPEMAQLIGLWNNKVQFRTGGYTGVWNDDSGRLAMLHQKELVLNADDTENFLSGISMIRDMTSLNGSINDAIANAVANMLFALNKTYSNHIFAASEKESITPNIFNITAEFPNANDVNEIREAILSLPNLASQYISQNTI